MSMELYVVFSCEGCSTEVRADYSKLTDKETVVFYNDNDDVEAVFKDFIYFHKIKETEE